MTTQNVFTTLPTKPEIVVHKAEFTVTNRGASLANVDDGESSVTFKGDMTINLYEALVEAIRAVMSSD